MKLTRSRVVRSLGLVISSIAKLSMEVAVQARVSSTPAGMNCHQVPCSRLESLCAQYKIVPQLTVDRLPRPRNCRAASAPMPYPIAPNSTVAISDDRFGSTRATRIRGGRSPTRVGRHVVPPDDGQGLSPDHAGRAGPAGDRE